MHATDFTISWDPVISDPVCGSVSYDVMISSDGVKMITNTTDTFYWVTGVSPGSSYNITVSGRNNAGVGPSNMIAVAIPSPTSSLPGTYIQYVIQHVLQCALLVCQLHLLIVLVATL